MLVLGLDTSTPVVSVAVVGRAGADVRVLGECEAGSVTSGQQKHGEGVAPAVRDALAAAGARVRDLTAIAVGTGPGPFTGLRVGLMTAAALADAVGLPAYGVPSLTAFAAGLGAPGRVCVTTDARRREVYWVLWADGAVVDGPGVESPAALADRLRGLGFGPTDLVAGPGAARYADLFAGLVTAHADAHPRGRDVALLALDRASAGAGSEALTPLYLRRPDAVEPAAYKAVRS